MSDQEWVLKQDGQFPENAKPVGITKDKKKIFLVRAHIAQGIHAGELVEGNKKAFVPYGPNWQVREEASYEVYVGEHRWHLESAGRIPKDALAVGREGPGDGGQLLYAARADVDGAQHVGKLRPEFRGAHIAASADRASFVSDNYQVLVRP